MVSQQTIVRLGLGKLLSSVCQPHYSRSPDSSKGLVDLLCPCLNNPDEVVCQHYHLYCILCSERHISMTMRVFIGAYRTCKQTCQRLSLPFIRISMVP